MNIIYDTEDEDHEEKYEKIDDFGIPENRRLLDIDQRYWNNLQVKGEGRLDTGESVCYVGRVVYPTCPLSIIFSDKKIVEVKVHWVDGYGLIVPYFIEVYAKKLYTVQVWNADSISEL